MSGSNSGGSSGSYVQELSCEKLRFEAQLTSPKAGVVSNLSLQEVLDIEITTMNNQIVVQVTKAGVLVGGLTGPDATMLRNCLNEGHKYKATVRSINGGQVRVLVEYA